MALLHRNTRSIDRNIVWVFLLSEGQLDPYCRRSQRESKNRQGIQGARNVLTQEINIGVEVTKILYCL